MRAGAVAAAPQSGGGPSAAGAGGGSGSAAAGTSAAGNTAPTPQAGAGAAGTAGVLASAGQSGAAGVAGMAAAGASGTAAGAGGTLPEPEPFTLTALDVEMYSATEVQFPDSALPPTNESPGFEWSGVPAEAKSLVLAFTDVSGPAYKWIVWDIPPTTTGLPAAMSDAAMPTEVPGASQLGSLGNQGYAGPCCADNHYEFVLWALDVDKLPDVERMSTAQIHNDVLPMHEIAKTPPVKMRRR